MRYIDVELIITFCYQIDIGTDDEPDQNLPFPKQSTNILHQ